MNRNSLIVASKHAIRLTFSFSHGQMRNSSVPISRFLGTSSPKKLHSWLYTRKLSSKNHGATSLSDHFLQSENQERELHQQKEQLTDIASDDEFEELGPSVTSPDNIDFRSLWEGTQTERKSSGIPTSYVNGKVSMLNDQGEDGNEGSGSADLLSVAIDNVPIGVNGEELRDVMSAFGEVKAISVAAGYNGLNSYHVEFKDRQSREKALNARKIAIGSTIVSIYNIRNARLIRIRTKKIGPEMTELAMHRMFRSYGDVKGLISRNDGACDVFVQLSSTNVERLVKKLDKRLVQEVELQKLNLKPLYSTCEETQKSELHFKRQLEQVRKKLELKLIYLEDLEHLHSAISHIKASKDSFMNVKNTNEDECSNH